MAACVYAKVYADTYPVLKMLPSDDAVLIVALIAIIIARRKRKKRRWVHPYLRDNVELHSAFTVTK